MATLVLGAVGTAVGGAFGGSILGLSGAAIGGIVGSAVGSVLDSWLVSQLAPAQRIEGQRLDSLRITSSTEGAVIPRLYGRMRIGGNIIWATDFREEVRTSTQGGGKGGGGPKVKTTEYLYSASFAVALCEGPITGIGRVWADGTLMDLSGVTWRWYPGDETQDPDPFIATTMSPEPTPAYRGTAYAVFEDLPLARYGNRLPQLSFEVFRPIADPDTAEGAIGAVTLIPASGEFTYATTPIRKGSGGETAAENLNALSDTADLVVALDRLQAMVPAVQSVSLVVSWFGTDLRAGQCEVRPGVEVAAKATTRSWSVNGVGRSEAHLVSRDDQGRPVYGGTPADFAVVEALRELRERGLRVTFYPFILMDVPTGNTLPNPYSDDAAETGQPAFPWRGRITCSPAAGYAGSVDRTSAAGAQVAALFGSAAAGDFAVSGDTVGWTGDPNDWGLRRMVLHYAHLCAAAGGIDAFLIGSEMRGLTTIRDGATSFPAVEAYRQLAADVRATLSPATKISYAADWSEYFGHQPADGSGDVFFHLDPLWADPNIDFVGIDNYVPLSDWRDGFEHADAQIATSIYDRAYLQANIAGGEGFEWFYASAADRAVQIRTPITDGAYGTPWVYRLKDLRSWWSEPHLNRIGGVVAENLFGNSPSTGLGWTGNASAEPGAGTGPLGDANATLRLTDDSTTATQQKACRTGPAAITTGASLVLSIYVRADAAAGGGANVRFTAVGSSNRVETRFRKNDPTTSNTVTAGTSLVLNSSGVEAVGGGWFRIWFRLTAIAEMTLECVVFPAWGTGIGGSASASTGTLEIWGLSGVASFDTEPGTLPPYYEYPVDGASLFAGTAWVPQSKPIRFTEFGCPAIDRGTNQPNVFFDPKSSESAVPYFSRGWRDDALQRAYLEAMALFWLAPANNPTSSVYGAPIVDWPECAAWTWDARPYPCFPELTDVWTDGANWRLGHWLTGRLGSVSLAALVRHLCLRTGMPEDRIDVSGLWGSLEGYTITALESPRASIAMLARYFGFDAVESEGVIRFVMRGQRAAATLVPNDLVASSDAGDVFELTRGQETELPQALKWQVARSDEDYDATVVEARRVTVTSSRIASESFPVAVPPEEAERRCRRALMEAWTGREGIVLRLPPSRLALDAADVIGLEHDGRTIEFRVTSIADAEARGLEAVLQDRTAYDLPPGTPRPSSPGSLPVVGAPEVVFLDLPQLTEDQAPHRPLVAAYARPWPGEMAVWRSPGLDGFELVTTFGGRARMGVLVDDLYPGPTSRFDLGNALVVDLLFGTIESVTDVALFGGGNAIAVEGAPGAWEILQAGSAELIAPGRYRLTRLLRGQRGTEGAMGNPAPSGARVVVLDAALTALPIAEADVGLPWNWRVGPASKPPNDDTYISRAFTSESVGLRPFSVAHVEQPWRTARTPGDLVIRWTRRSRALSADSWNTVEVPLGEETEAYEVEILDGATVKRTLTSSTTSATYAAAQQISDFGALLSPGDALDIRIFQLSALVGRGAPKTVALFL